MATFSLQKYLKEPDFASEFLERGGLESLCEIIKKASGNTLAYALNSFTSLMEHNTGWDSLSEDFVVEIAHIVVNETLVTIGRPATAILIKIVTANGQYQILPSSEDNTNQNDNNTQENQSNNTSTTAAADDGNHDENKNEDNTSSNNNKKMVFGYPILQKAIEKEPQLLPTLVQRLQSQDYTLCLNSLALLTAMLKTVTEEHRNELPERLDQLGISKNIVRIMNNHLSEELKGQLLEYQTADIQNAVQRRKTPVSLNNTKDMKMLNEIWDAAKVSSIQVHGARKWKKIGFSSESPQKEFSRTGLFGLQRMHAFVMQNQDLFSKMILEQIHRPENKRCLFAKASCEVTELIFSHWNINSRYIAANLEPIMMYMDRVQASTLQLFFRIFQDMEATSSDFSKVSALVRSQLRAVLKSESGKDIGEFERAMSGTPYQIIRDRRLKELEWADDLLGREAIKNLRARLNKQSYDFIKKQRINCLLQGAWFPSPLISQRSNSIATVNGNVIGGNDLIGSSGSGSGSGHHPSKRWRYYKLCPSKKCLQFGDFAERIAPTIKEFDKLPNKVDLHKVIEIRTIRKGSNVGVSSLFPSPPNQPILTSATATNPTATGASTAMTLTSSSGGGVGNNNNNSSSNNNMLSSSYASQFSNEYSSSSSTSALSFALFNENNIPIVEFICATSEQASEWKDGFSMLLDKGITSKETAEYLHSLTEIGVKVKLLQIAGDRVEVPDKSLEIPPLPTGPNTRFYYDI
ncbi:unnamed protein product [Cunninghamella echinulata]